MMEQLAPAAYNPHILRVLKSYQTAAMQSLSGPSSHLAAWATGTDPAKMDLEQYRKALSALLKKDKTDVYDPVFTLPPFPIQQMPGMCMPLDPSRSEKSETVLEGHTIACFMVGGERRLCLPQILNTVLREFTLQQINAVCDELHIFCSRCNPEQLETLKVAGILPMSAPSCGLITKTDAERLCNALLHKNPEKSREPPTPNCFLVYHECFGKCKGLFNPDLYIDPYAKCIECMDCHGMFSPQKFVCHSHKALENRTCHWGFDSANWRAYLLLAKEQSHIGALQRTLDDIKARFDFTSRFKRKQSPLTNETKDVSKRSRSSESPENVPGTNSPCEDGTADNQLRLLSAFRPWSPSSAGSNASRPDEKGPLLYERSKGVPSFSNQEPPVLLNPEKVVPHDADVQRNEPLFAPNVALAPPEFQKKPSEDNRFLVSEPHVSKSSLWIDTDDEEFEVNVSSDTEDEGDGGIQSSSSSGLSTPRENVSLALSRSVESEEMKQLHAALDNKNNSTMKAQVEKLFQDMQHSFNEQINELKNSNATLEKKYEALRGKYLQLALKSEDENVKEKNESKHQNGEESIEHVEESCKQKYKGKVALVHQCLDQYDSADRETPSESDSNHKRRSLDSSGKDAAKSSRVSPTKLQENGPGSPEKAANSDSIAEKAPSLKKCESPGSKYISAKS